MRTKGSFQFHKRISHFTEFAVLKWGPRSGQISGHEVYTYNHTHTYIQYWATHKPKSDYVCSCESDQWCYTHPDQWWNLQWVCARVKIKLWCNSGTENEKFLFFQLIKARPEAMDLKRLCISCDSSVNFIDLLRNYVHVCSRDSGGISWGPNIWLPSRVVSFKLSGAVLETTVSWGINLTFSRLSINANCCSN